MSKEKKNIPELRFPEFEGDGEWAEKAIEDIAQVTTGNKDTQDKVEEGKYPFFVRSQTIERINSFSFDGEAILTSGDGVGVGKIYHYIIGKFDFHQRVYCIYDFEGHVEGKFVFYFFSEHFYNRVMQLSAKNSVDSVRRAMVTEMPIYLPNITEQQKIAACLSSLDDLITAHNDKLEALKDHQKGLMQNLFPQEGEKAPKYRFPEFEEDGEWVAKDLGDVCNMQAGKFVRASEIHEKIADDLYPCFGGNGLRGYTKSFTHSGKYSLIGRQGALCGNVTLAHGQFHATEHAVVVTPEKNVDTDWLFHVLVLLNLNQFATGQAQPGLSVNNLKKVELYIPKSEKEQQKIAACLSALDALITAQAEKIEQLQQHKKGLMQGLFPKV